MKYCRNVVEDNSVGNSVGNGTKFRCTTDICPLGNKNNESSHYLAMATCFPVARFRVWNIMELQDSIMSFVGQPMKMRLLNSEYAAKTPVERVEMLAYRLVACLREGTRMMASWRMTFWLDTSQWAQHVEVHMTGWLNCPRNSAWDAVALKVHAAKFKPDVVVLKLSDERWIVVMPSGYGGYVSGYRPGGVVIEFTNK